MSRRADAPFSAGAMRLMGQMAWLLHWRPADFWNATPAEVAAVLQAGHPDADEAMTRGDMQRLMEQFPDGRGY